MTHEAFDRALATRFGERLRRAAPLAPLTTFRVGGPADWLLELQQVEDVRAALMIAREHGVPVVPLGGGSNVLVPDAGIRGLVIRLHGGSMVRVAEHRIRADGGVTINGARITDAATIPEPIAGEWLDVRIGKRRREIGRTQG